MWRTLSRTLSRSLVLLSALGLVAVLSACGSEPTEAHIDTTTKAVVVHLRTDTRGDDAYAGVTFSVDCRTFEAGDPPLTLGMELPLPAAATVVMLDGPAAPISIVGTKIALRATGDYTIACKVPSVGLQDAVGAHLEVVPGPASVVETRLQRGADVAVDNLITKAGPVVTVRCSGTDAWGNAIVDGWHVSAIPAKLSIQTTGAAPTIHAIKAGSWQVLCRNSGSADPSPATLTVTPAPPRHLFTLLEPTEIAAGNAAKLGCVATDVYGNTISGFPFSMDYTDEVKLKGLYVSSTKAGIHTLKCVPETDKWALYEIHAGKLLVRPGPPETLIIGQVPDKPVYKREEKVKFPATVQDAWGNIRPDDPVTVTVLTPTTGWKVLEADPKKDKLVRFDDDGTYKLRFQVSLSAISKELSILVDGAPPLLTIDDPPWGSTLTGKPSVQIKGKAGDAGSGIKSLTINGKTGYVDGANQYQVQHGAKHGLNTVLALAEDMGGEMSEATRGFYYSGKYYNTDVGKPKGAMVHDAIQIFIGAKLLDDGVHDPNKPDDFSTIMELLIGSQMSSGLIPSNLSQGALEVKLSNTKMGKPTINLIPVQGALDVKMRIEKISTDLKVKAKLKLGPIKTSLSVSGDIKMDAVRISMRLLMAVNNGKASASVVDSSVKIDGMKLSVDGIAGLFNPLFNLLLNGYKSQIEQQLKNALVGELPKMLNGVLSQLSATESFDVPGSAGNAPTVKVTMVSQVSTLAFTPEGALLKVDASFVAAKGTKHTILGAISRDGCIGKSPDKFAIDTKQAMQIALHDDLINQLLYAIWYGGGMTMTIPGSELGGGQAAPGISLENATLDVDLLLPPILEACNMEKPSLVRLQIGDIFSTLRIPFGSDEMALYLAASLDVPAEVVFGKSKNGEAEVKVMPGKSVGMQIELTDISKNFAEQKATFAKLIKDLIAKELAKGIPDADKLKIALPSTETDLSSLAPGIPVGTKVKVAVKGLQRAGGYSAISAALE